MTDPHDFLPEDLALPDSTELEQDSIPLEPLPTDVTRTRVADVVQPQETTAIRSNVERLDFIGYGDRLMQAGHFGAALDAYAAAGAKNKLLALADQCFQEGHLSVAESAYIAAGAYYKLILVGDRYTQQGFFDLAAQAYAKAGANTKRIELAARFLQGIPKEQIITHLGLRS